MKIKKPRNTRIITDLEECKYTPGEFGSSLKNKGEGIKIGLISSGIAVHDDINKFTEFETFCSSGKDPNDKHGQSTMVSGVISGNGNNKITGLAPYSDIYYCKVIEDNGNISIPNVISGIVWCIVKNVDIIVIPFAIEEYSEILSKLVEKAVNKHNILIIASYDSNLNTSYPALFDSVLPVYSKPSNNKDFTIEIENKILTTNINKNNNYFTTFRSNKYCKIFEDELGTPIITSLAALHLSNLRHNKTEYSAYNIKEWFLKKTKK